VITDCIPFASSFVDRDMFMRLLGIGIGHCGQHPTEADIAASDGNDSQTSTMDNESDGDTAEEDKDTHEDDEDEDTDLEEYGDGGLDSDEDEDDDLGYDDL
jgi:hypothetical protein